MNAKTMTVAKLVRMTEKAANMLLSNPGCSTFDAECITRKIDALKSIPTAANALRVLQDLKMINEGYIKAAA